MGQKPIAFSPVVRSLILETTRGLLPDHRDAVTGEIADKALAAAVVKALDTDAPDIARTGRAEAWGVGVYQAVREHLRLSMGRFEVHHRDHRDAENRVRARQRLFVTFRDRAGELVNKERSKLRMDEIPLVRAAYERIAAGANEVVIWCDAVWEQMDLLGLGDGDLVERVVDCPDADDEATGAA